MRKNLVILLTAIFLVTVASAQNKAVYGELGGNGLVFSANYDMRFSKAENGFGFRVGVGFAAASDVSVVTFPLGINYLTGKGPHHLEIGFGVTPVTATIDFFDDTETGSTTFIMPTLGYRYAHQNKGFVGRIYVGPILVGGETVFPWGGISAGIKF